MAILVTGGAGFIGSHTCVELLNAGYDVVIADNLYNASEKAVDRVKQITGKDLKFYKADIRDKEAMNEIFEKEEIESVIHFAGLKAVGESVVKPLEYYENNIAGTLVLCDVMRNHGVKNIIFSSSATVYGDPAFIPITEECPKGTCTNPYGWTKEVSCPKTASGSHRTGSRFPSSTQENPNAKPVIGSTRALSSRLARTLYRGTPVSPPTVSIQALAVWVMHFKCQSPIPWGTIAGSPSSTSKSNTPLPVFSIVSVLASAPTHAFGKIKYWT